ncbi:MAG: hypothetical protein GW939_01500 [Candidatus Magasanikbacteria bacterium]|uniref:Ribulose-phosphate 3-epimerase n=1 Tax=Candidatus Magasanikbacteria bacterium CG10_big_fil_rev_8_21_14_0_10_38_6 TaxID=1974647 RepID=A0A2M6P270_9BACT|nr:hypothetical protein [Candidatus Magasanikbacteria bacterium]NCS71982.1 hypothetical protein [Candidatus Magasanikbacteria bacterium]PIR77530.1 MAG: hypothetical protein COU30_01935 [Candidatus Magasanikbacteria bacterium CG10_big_fil_rev_8_21_14_0_10_38_6]
MHNIEIIPSILVKTEQEFLTQSAAVSDCVNMIQLDIADGIFVPNTTWHPDPDTITDNLEIDCELHLMVSNPLEEARRFEFVDQIKRILIHYESTPNIEHVIGAIHSYGWEVGLVLKPETPITVIDTYNEEIDAVMLMGVNPGLQGQSFIPETLQKIITLHKTYPNLFISLDGAVNEQTIIDIAKTHIHAVCPGSAIFGNNNSPKQNIQNMYTLIDQASKQ